MAGRTSAKVKNRWNAEHYDRITIFVQKGEKEVLAKAAKEEGITVARLFVNALNAQRPGLLTTLDKILPSMREKPQEAPEELSDPANEETPEEENGVSEEPSEPSNKEPSES